MDEKYDFEAIALAALREEKWYKGWQPIFYPTPARLFALGEGRTVQELIQHSFMKWLGLMPAVLQKARLVLDDRDMWEIAPDGELVYAGLVINASSCSLCRAYYRRKNTDKCTICPIYRSRWDGKDYYKCDEPMPDEPYSPWETWQKTGDPIPMLEALVLAGEFAKNNPEMYQGGQWQPGDDGQ